MFINKQIFAIISILSFYLGSSQSNWNIAIGSQFQLTTLKADSDFLNESSGSSAGINLGISYSLNKNWSIHSGAGLIFIQSRNDLGNFNDQENAQDLEGENFEFRYNFINYIEEQKHVVLSIPLAVQFETNGTSTRFYSKLGGSVNLFLDSTAEAKANGFSTTGFFDRFNAELDTPMFAGFGNFDRITFAEQDVDLKSSINALIEFGIKQNLSHNHWIYIGLFADFGLNNIVESNDKSLIEFNSNNPTDFIANSLLNARNKTTNQAFLDKLFLNTIGVRLTYKFKGL